MRHLLVVVVLLSVALAEDKIHVERSEDAVIVRSPADQANFLFRAPASFKENEAQAPFLLDLAAEGAAGERARIRLRITTVVEADSLKNPEELARAREAEYRKGFGGKLEFSGAGVRRLARCAGAGGARSVLLVRDGDRLYELFLEESPAGSSFAPALDELASGFTILAPKGAPAEVRLTPEELKAKVLVHEYYRLQVLKPDGFTQEEVDPDKEKGIWLHLRKKDRYKNLCEIKIRVHLARMVQKTTEERAQAAIDRFARRFENARVPRRPKRTGWKEAKHAFKAEMTGRVEKSGLVVHQDYRIVDHANGRLYEFQITMWAGARREFRKQIAAFWKRLKILPK
ncbi:MAG: hypothetical protein ACYTGV_11130 [Planctomycetota bacterium]|jgi:hypothetical protein